MYILSDPPPSLGGNTELTVIRKIDKRALWEMGEDVQGSKTGGQRDQSASRGRALPGELCHREREKKTCNHLPH